VCARRSKLLPDGGSIAEVTFANEVSELKEIVTFARNCREMQRDAEARALWHDAYTRLSAEIPGALGSVLARAEAQTLRLSMIYALLDGSQTIRRAHLAAALALWDYCERSARHIFGTGLGDRHADNILAALQAAPNGMTRRDINEDIFARNVAGSEIARCLDLLLINGLTAVRGESTGGRGAQRWFAPGSETN